MKKQPVARPARRRRRAWPWVLAVTLALAGAIAWFVAVRRAPAPVAPDPLASTPPREAFEAGRRLSDAGRYGEALPYYRKAITGEGASRWSTRIALAYALRNHASADTLHLGLRIPTTRSAVERVQLLREAMGELDQAARLARRADEVAETARLRGLILSQWGFVTDALVVYRQAEAMDSTGRLGSLAEGLAQRLRDPSTGP